MNILCILQDHDHEPCSVFIDSSKLQESNPVDAVILAAIKKERPETENPGEWHASLNANGWDDEGSPFGGSEPCISWEATLDKKFPLSIDTVVWLRIYYE